MIKPSSSFAGRVLRATPVCAVMLFAAGPVAAQVLNGNFESSPQSTPFVTVSTSAFISPPTGWQVATGSVRVGDKPAGTPCHNAHCVELNGSGPARLSQVLVASYNGKKCVLTFWMSRNVRLASSSASLTTYINGTTISTFVHNTAGVTANDGRWEQHTIMFLVMPGSTLSFESNTPGSDGPQIDDVQGTCTDPPVIHVPTSSEVGQSTTGGTGTLKQVSFGIEKVLNNSTLKSGTFTFSLACTVGGTAVSVTPNPVSVTYPKPGISMVTVVTGAVCTVTETQPAGNWDPPTFKGRASSFNLAVTPGKRWSATVGPISADGGVLQVVNVGK